MGSVTSGQHWRGRNVALDIRVERGLRSMPLNAELGGVLRGVLCGVRRYFSGSAGALILLLALFLSAPVQAQSLAELATYSGPDRTQKLIDGAKKENALTIYSSMT